MKKAVEMLKSSPCSHLVEFKTLRNQFFAHLSHFDRFNLAQESADHFHSLDEKGENQKQIKYEQA